MPRLSSHCAVIPSFLLLCSIARASEPVDSSPPAAPSENEEENLQPEVQIIQRIDKTIEEYRINGRLYKIKVTPKVGPAYYLIDSNGDGSFQAVPVGAGPEPNLLIPQWVLFRW
jgi:Protein of unknown function (DUF2782)